MLILDRPTILTLMWNLLATLVNLATSPTSMASRPPIPALFYYNALLDGLREQLENNAHPRQQRQMHQEQHPQTSSSYPLPRPLPQSNSHSHHQAPASSTSPPSSSSPPSATHKPTSTARPSTPDTIPPDKVTLDTATRIFGNDNTIIINGPGPGANKGLSPTTRPSHGQEQRSGLGLDFDDLMALLYDAEEVNIRSGFDITGNGNRIVFLPPVNGMDTGTAHDQRNSKSKSNSGRHISKTPSSSPAGADSSVGMANTPPVSVADTAGTAIVGSHIVGASSTGPQGHEHGTGLGQGFVTGMRRSSGVVSSLDRGRKRLREEVEGDEDEDVRRKGADEGG